VVVQWAATEPSARSGDAPQARQVELLSGEAPDGGVKAGFELSGEADEFVLVFGEPGEAVDEEAGILDR